MDQKLIDAYSLINKAFESGLLDDQEIVKLLQETFHMNEEGAIMALASYYDNKKEIKDYLKNNIKTSDKTPKQFGE